MIFYNANAGEPFYPQAALSALAGAEVRLAHDDRGFRVVLPSGLDPAEKGEPDAWASYSSGPQPSRDVVAAWRPPLPEVSASSPLTDVERNFQKIQERLNSDEAKRTGRPVNPDGAVPLSRAMAATCMLTQGWHYPTEADLETEFNQFLLGRIYEDPTTNTNAGSSTDQKRRALHFTLVMLEGQSFGLAYQAQLGAYERTASGQFLADLTEDNRDWLDLACPKMHKDWPEFGSIREMFQAVMA